MYKTTRTTLTFPHSDSFTMKNKDSFTQQPSLDLSSTIGSLRNNPPTHNKMDPVTTAGAPS